MTRFNVFFDHNCPPSMARMLAGFLSYAKPPPRVHALREVLPINTSDVDWIAWLKAQGDDWVVVTENFRISKVPAERKAFADARLRMLVTPKSLLSLPHEKRCAVFLWQWPRVVEAMEQFDPPVMWQISPKIGGRLTQLSW